MTPRIHGLVGVIQRGPLWYTCEPLRYESSLAVIVVPENTPTDFASIPKLFRNIMEPTDERWSAAAIFHDRAYATHELDRATADAVLYECARFTGANLVAAYMLWSQVRLWGRWSYASGPQRLIDRRLAYYAAPTRECG